MPSRTIWLLCLWGSVLGCYSNLDRAESALKTMRARVANHEDLAALLCISANDYTITLIGG